MEELPDLEAGTDAYGEAIRDYHEGDDAFEVVERDDGWVGPSNGPMLYFERYEEWDEHVQRAIERARGRVLDVGVGAGRHALHLQDQGHDVTGVDVSPGALAVARDRGVDDVRECDVAAVTNEFDPDTFETVLMLGNNFGLVGTADRTPAILDELATVTTDDATILAGSANPLATDDPHHREYHEFNRDRGRLPGALRIRVRYKTYATDWFDYLYDGQQASSKRVGIRTGAVGAVATLVPISKIVTAFIGPVASSPLWFRVAAPVLALGLVVPVFVGLTILTGMVGGLFGGWLAKKTGRRRPPAVGS